MDSEERGKGKRGSRTAFSYARVLFNPPFTPSLELHMQRGRKKKRGGEGKEEKIATAHHRPGQLKAQTRSWRSPPRGRSRKGGEGIGKDASGWFVSGHLFSNRQPARPFRTPSSHYRVTNLREGGGKRGGGRKEFPGRRGEDSGTDLEARQPIKDVNDLLSLFTRTRREKQEKKKKRGRQIVARLKEPLFEHHRGVGGGGYLPIAFCDRSAYSAREEKRKKKKGGEKGEGEGKTFTTFDTGSVSGKRCRQLFFVFQRAIRGRREEGKEKKEQNVAGCGAYKPPRRGH